MARGLLGASLTLACVTLAALAGGAADAADTTKVDKATKQLEQGGKDVRRGQGWYPL